MDDETEKDLPVLLDHDVSPPMASKNVSHD